MSLFKTMSSLKTVWSLKTMWSLKTVWSLKTGEGRRAKLVFAARRELFAGSLAMLLALPLLAGCGASGFRPLHGPAASGENLSELLSAVSIRPIPGRVGQQLRNKLIFETTGGNYANAPKYSLTIAIRERITSTLVQRSGESLGQVYNLTASFKLTDIKTKKLLMKGKSYGRAGFERYISAYANVRARIDAENRAATAVGKEINSRLAAFLAAKS